MLSVPFAHDQPDNAHRLRRMGVGVVIPAKRYTAPRAVRALRACWGALMPFFGLPNLAKKSGIM
jgi:UDP:flavonoid glycosyltransferase YjiC (YdhE family)